MFFPAFGCAGGIRASGRMTNPPLPFGTHLTSLFSLLSLFWEGARACTRCFGGQSCDERAGAAVKCIARRSASAGLFWEGSPASACCCVSSRVRRFSRRRQQPLLPPWQHVARGASRCPSRAVAPPRELPPWQHVARGASRCPSRAVAPPRELRGVEASCAAPSPSRARLALMVVEAAARGGCHATAVIFPRCSSRRLRLGGMSHGAVSVARLWLGLSAQTR